MWMTPQSCVYKIAIAPTLKVPAYSPAEGNCPTRKLASKETVSKESFTPKGGAKIS